MLYIYLKCFDVTPLRNNQRQSAQTFLLPGQATHPYTSPPHARGILLESEDVDYIRVCNLTWEQECSYVRIW